MWYVMKIGQDNNVTNRISAIYVENNYELFDRWDQVQFVTKTWLNNNVTNCISAVYIENVLNYHDR